MHDGIEIVDGHMHLYTTAFERRVKKRLEQAGEGTQRAFQTWYDWFTTKYSSDLLEQNDDPPAKIAADWALELDRVGVDRAIFIALDPEDEELGPFLQKKAGRFFGLATVNPLDQSAPEQMRRRAREGYVGLKLYPTTGCYYPSDRTVYPVYEEAQALGWPIMLHLGITLQYESDLRYANPIELHPVAKDFPDTSFIIPHFAAGYFQELLFLGYHVNNIYVDTSGLNRWMDYVPYEMSLRRVFEQTLDIFGPEKIIYGTDSRMLSKGYRQGVFEEQDEILKSLRLSAEERTLIMGKNMLRLIGKE